MPLAWLFEEAEERGWRAQLNKIALQRGDDPRDWYVVDGTNIGWAGEAALALKTLI